jgi:hypothetical protein
VPDGLKNDQAQKSAEVHENADRESKQGRKIGILADQLAVLADEGEREQHDRRRDHNARAEAAIQAYADKDQRRRRQFGRHRPHHTIDVGPQHRHVGEDVERLIGGTAIDHEAERIEQRSKETDRGDGGGKQAKDTTAQESCGAEIAIERAVPRGRDCPASGCLRRGTR